MSVGFKNRVLFPIFKLPLHSEQFPCFNLLPLDIDYLRSDPNEQVDPPREPTPHLSASSGTSSTSSMDSACSSSKNNFYIFIFYKARRGNFSQWLYLIVLKPDLVGS